MLAKQGEGCCLSPVAEYCMAVTATPSWGCSFISISEEAIWKILKVPSLYPAATHAPPLLEEGFQHTQPQAWQEKKEGIIILACHSVGAGFFSADGVLSLSYRKTLKVCFYHSCRYQLSNHQIIKDDQWCQIKCSLNCPITQAFLCLLALKIGAFPHLAEDLKLHH